MSRGLPHLRWILALLLCAGACSDAPAPRGRVLLLGIDGASLRIVGPLMEQGRLPRLERIASRGVSGPLRSFPPLLSPRVWTSVATGKAPARHGIRGWVTRVDDHTLRLYTGRDRKVHALWNIASDAGLEVGVVNWLMTYPPERIRGVMVSDHAQPGAARGQRNLGEMFARHRAGMTLAKADPAGGPVCFPEEWSAKVSALVGERQPWSPELSQDEERNLRWVSETNLAYDREIVEIAKAVDAEIHPDVLMVLLQGIDRVSHVLWASVEPDDLYPPRQRLTPSQKQAWSSALFRYYEQTDVLIGELVDRFDEDDLVLVLSDHGFEAVVGQVGTGGHESPKARDGVLFARGAGIPAGGSTGGTTVNDITPTILAWLGLPVAADMDGHPAEFLGFAAPASVATYDTTPIERVTTAPSGAEQDIIEKLRSLGYVD